MAASSRVDRCVRDHYFNHRAELLLPWASASSEAGPLAACESAVRTDCFWRVSGPMAALLQPAFVDRHIRRGGLCALAATALDGGSGLAITPRGDLLIVCETHLYRSLGLEGLASAFAPRGGRHCVRVPLLDAAFARGGAKHDRLIEVARRLGEAVLLVSWEIDGVSADPTFPPELRCARCDLTSSVTRYEGLRIPAVRSLLPGDDEAEEAGAGAEAQAADFIGILADEPPGGGGAAAGEEALRQLHEWIGLVALRAREVLERLPASPHAIGGLTLDSLPLEAAGGVLEAHECTGLVGQSTVRRLLAQASALVEAGALPWAALTVWGFCDAPISWGLCEHDAHHGNPENDYTVLLLPRGRRVIFYAVASADGFRPPQAPLRRPELPVEDEHMTD